MANNPYNMVLSSVKISAILLLSFYILVPETYADIKLFSLSKDIANPTRLCPAPGAPPRPNYYSCPNFTIDQAKSVCFTTLYNYNYIRITQHKCNGVTCHLEVATDSKTAHAAIDCKQKTDIIANCTCSLYRAQ
ncbi:hypothetical protein M8J76_002957 [Diaphorina citri]|nr:hypothetical protein M8J75_005056 [Diaphorina citri]KAI5744506.1 hypothetical protein M8J76_002957 [Diaphorina citri]KAI5751494.1 hypothetical protein M8J77_008002 [Diaphorina citri]